MPHLLHWRCTVSVKRPMKLTSQSDVCTGGTTGRTPSCMFVLNGKNGKIQASIEALFAVLNFLHLKHT
jgi:hypothetical protein